MKFSDILPEGASYTDYLGIPRLKPYERNCWNQLWFMALGDELFGKNIAEKVGVRSGCVISRVGTTYDIACTSGEVRINETNVAVDTPSDYTCANNGWYFFHIDSSGDLQVAYYWDETIQGATTPDAAAYIGFAIRQDANFVVRSIFYGLSDFVYTNDLSAEATTRGDDDATLQGNIDAIDGKISANATSGNRAQSLTDVEALIAALVDSSPAALDTLNELAAALGDDENFAATMTNALATKMAKDRNLNDVDSKPISRTNLDVYSKLESERLAGVRSIVAAENITAGDLVEIINDSGTAKAKKIQSEIGTALQFEAGMTLDISAVALSSSKVLIAYTDSNDAKGKAMILSVSGTVLTAGTAVEIGDGGLTGNFSTVALSSTKALVAYEDGGDANSGKAVVLSVSGTTIAKNTVEEFETGGSARFISAVALSSTVVLVAYSDNTDLVRGKAVVLSISGTTITRYTGITFESDPTWYISAVALSATKVLVAYQNGVSTQHGEARILMISGTTIVASDEVAFEGGNINCISAVALSSTKVLVAYRDNDDVDSGKAVVLEIDDTTIAPGTEETFHVGSTGFISAVALSETKVIVSYCASNASNEGRIAVLAISGMTIAMGQTQEFHDAQSFHIEAIRLSSTKVLIGYAGVFSAGDAIVIPVGNLADQIDAIALETKTTGQTGLFGIGNNIIDATGSLTLEPSVEYYIGNDSAITPLIDFPPSNPFLTCVRKPIGKARTATELILY